jgi:hypothetical protein
MQFDQLRRREFITLIGAAAACIRRGADRASLRYHRRRNKIADTSLVSAVERARPAGRLRRFCRCSAADEVIE